MSSHRRPVAPKGHRRSSRARAHRLLPVALGLTLLGVGGVVGPSVVDNVAGRDADNHQLALTAVPADAPAEGLIYDGLQPAKAGSICAGSFQLDAQTCTHGPDPAPAGLQVPRDVSPVTAKAPEPVQPSREGAGVPADAEIARDEGGSALTADAPALIPDAAPGQADFIMGAHDVACEGDGRGGKRVQVLYLHEFGSPSRYSDFVGSIRNWSAGADQIFDESAGETGGSRHVRFVTTPQCRVDVSEVQLPAGELKSFAASIGALRTLGYNRTDRKYLMFADTNVYCGIATFIADQRPGLGNRNNGGPSYGRVDSGCWSSVMAAQELTRTLGAVLIGSPNADGAGGCRDEHELLCGPGRGGKDVRNVCPKRHETRLDCGHDDYFSTNPRPGSYLTKHWNIAQSEFLLRSDGGDDVPDSIGTVGEAPAPTTAPAKPAAPTPSVPAEPTAPAPGGTAAPDDPGTGDGSGDAPPDPAVTPTDGAEPTEPPADPPADGPTAGPPAQPVVASARPQAQPARTEPQPEPVQAVLEIRDATSSSVRLTWSAASPAATYEVSVDGAPIATTQATRARLVGLKPDAKYRVTIKSGARYTANATAETAPGGRPAQSSWFTLSNALTGGAADLYAARTSDGTPLTLSGRDGDAQQQWQLVPAGDNSYSLVSRATGKCAVPLGGDAVAGAPLVQGSCGTGTHWALQASDYGFTLRSTAGGLVAGVGDQRYGAHRVLVLQRSTGQRHQSWTAVPD